MATYWTFYCDGDRLISTDGAGNAYAACVGNAGWVQIDSPVQSTSLDAGRAASAFGAGFVVMGVGLLLVSGLRIVIRAVRDW